MAEILNSNYQLKNGLKVIIRTGVPSDAEALLECARAYMNDGEGQVWEPGEFTPTEEAERQWITQLFKNPKEILIVAEVEGQIVANLDFHAATRRRRMHVGGFGLSCLPKYRGLGIGSLLIQEMLKWAKSTGHFEKVNLNVLSNNPRAIGLYEKFGFIEEGRRLKEFKYTDGSYADEINMGLFL
jgi:RimJ/RimL family protein N-acetyltransferase